MEHSIESKDVPFTANTYLCVKKDTSFGFPLFDAPGPRFRFLTLNNLLPDTPAL